MTPIFNSLGSNYSTDDVVRLSTVKASPGSREKLKIKLKKYLRDAPIQIELFYKGREALEVGLKALNLPTGSEVGITGFTCYVVEQSVKRAGLNPVFLDVEKDSLNFGVKSLKDAKAKGAKLRVLILQNTFGFQMEELAGVLNFAKKHRIIVVEDAAHGFGGFRGDLAIFSFSQDKMLDVVSGGALVINNPKFRVKNELLNVQEVAMAQQQKDRGYAKKTKIIREWYELGLGKILHKHWKKTNKLSSPMTYIGDEKIHKMTTWQAQRAAQIFGESFEKNRRLQIAKYYLENIDSKWRVKDITLTKIDCGSCLRYPLLVPAKKRADLIKYLAKHKIYASDIWYDNVIAPKSFEGKSSYKKGECPNAEKLVTQIFNLPTHKQINLEKAEKIVKLVNEYLKNDD
ncbi:MAG: DegT/DnrJ/EryC1/StrS family aminotransferase [Pseudomonadales bacterium]|jgi:dTDP-4-amino-4,6-dideoxygalactose transaminase|nr:DegT/DnrJ/EryC1/StrS family aminotransferase [Pseudomonadales bacterium]